MFFCSKYSTATGRDLWDAFQKSIELTSFTELLPRNADIITIMESWEKQAGVPVLNVTRTYSSSFVQFSQVPIRHDLGRLDS